MISKDIDEMRTHLQEAHKHRIEVAQELLSLQKNIPSVPPTLEKRLGLLQISFAISIVMNHLLWKQLSPAKKETKRALKIAADLEDELSIARCNYWLGRIEFEPRNMAAAHTFFKAARPCIIDDEHPEGSSLYFYLDLSKAGIGEEYRKRALLDHNHAVVKNVSKKPGSKISRTNHSHKRKRDSQTWNLVLRPADGPHRSQLESGMDKDQHKQSQQRKRSTVWMVRDTEDVPPSAKTSTIEGKQSHSDGMEWLAAAQSRPRLQQCKFTVRCYPKGLAPRTRPTMIFPEQPGENLLSADQWRALQAHFKDRVVTMSYLARERRKNKKAEKKQTVGSRQPHNSEYGF